MTRKLNIDKGYNDTVDRRPAGNSGFAKKRVQWLIEHSTPHQLLWCIGSFELRNPLLRKAAKRYRKPYDDRPNIKQRDMKQTFLDNITEPLTARPTSLSNEVLFFATAHFLFFNFLATAENTLSLFCNRTNPDLKKNERVFSPTLYFSIGKLFLSYFYIC